MTLRIEQFIDIHTHILPGLDDGPSSIEESLEIANLYEQQGVKHIVATPHFLPGTAWSAGSDRVLETLKLLQTRLIDKKINLRIDAGMEIGFHKRLVENLTDGLLLPLGKSEHYLVEPSFHGEQERLQAMLDCLLKGGWKIILAHPERADVFQHKPEIVLRLVGMGLKVQVNSGSLLGHYGKRPQKISKWLLERDCVHFIASDTHNCIKRAPITATHWQQLVEMDGGEDLLHRCGRNLINLFGGQD